MHNAKCTAREDAHAEHQLPCAALCLCGAGGEGWGEVAIDSLHSVEDVSTYAVLKTPRLTLVV